MPALPITRASGEASRLIWAMRSRTDFPHAAASQTQETLAPRTFIIEKRSYALPHWWWRTGRHHYQPHSWSQIPNFSFSKTQHFPHFCFQFCSELPCSSSSSPLLQSQGRMGRVWYPKVHKAPSALEEIHTPHGSSTSEPWHSRRHKPALAAQVRIMKPTGVSEYAQGGGSSS